MTHRAQEPLFIATDDEQELDAIAQSYQQTLEDFDDFDEAILNGKTFDDGIVVIKTDNEALSRLVTEADNVHNNKFQVAAREMMNGGRQLVAQAKIRDALMLNMEETYDELMALAAMSGNGSITTAPVQAVGHAAHGVGKKRLHDASGQPRLQHKPQLVAAGKQAGSSEEFMSLDDKKGLSGF